MWYLSLVWLLFIYPNILFSAEMKSGEVCTEQNFNTLCCQGNLLTTCANRPTANYCTGCNSITLPATLSPGCAISLTCTQRTTETCCQNKPGCYWDIATTTCKKPIQCAMVNGECGGCITSLTCEQRHSKTCCDRNSSCKWKNNICIKDCPDSLTCTQRAFSTCCISKSTCSWDSVTNTCGRSCSFTTSGTCNLYATLHGRRRGNTNSLHNALEIIAQTINTDQISYPCKSGYGGGCAYTCRNGSFVDIVNNCKKNCRGEYRNGCSIQGNAHGMRALSGCDINHTGRCKYKCNNGNWEKINNTCRRRCYAFGNNRYRSYCFLGNRTINHDETIGRCVAPKSSGTCQYRCNNGSYIKVYNNCY